MAWIKEKLKQATRILLNIFMFLLARGFVALTAGASVIALSLVYYLPKHIPETENWIYIYLLIFLVGAFILSLVQHIWHHSMPFITYMLIGMVINFAIVYYYTSFSISGLLTYIMVIAYPFLTPTN